MVRFLAYGRRLQTSCSVCCAETPWWEANYWILSLSLLLVPTIDCRCCWISRDSELFLLCILPMRTLVARLTFFELCILPVRTLVARLWTCVPSLIPDTRTVRPCEFCLQDFLTCRCCVECVLLLPLVGRMCAWNVRCEFASFFLCCCLSHIPLPSSHATLPSSVVIFSLDPFSKFSKGLHPLQGSQRSFVCSVSADD